jgi:hypothetical protein
MEVVDNQPSSNSSSSNNNNNDIPLKIFVHPLAITSICDHYTRVQVGNHTTLSQDSPVIGLMFGVREVIRDGENDINFNLNITDCTDSIYDIKDGQVDFFTQTHQNDEGEWVITCIDAIAAKISMWKQNFPTHDLLGCYALGKEVIPMYMDIHLAMKTNFNIISPIFLLMNPNPNPESRVIPLVTFQSENIITNGVSSNIFVDIPFKLESFLVEKIAIDQVSKFLPSNGKTPLEVQNQSLLISLNTLDRKTSILLKALNAMKSGEIPMDHDLLRNSAKLVESLPVMNSSKFQKAFNNDIMDTKMIEYLAASTKTTSDLVNITDLFSSIYSESSNQY